MIVSVGKAQDDLTIHVDDPTPQIGEEIPLSTRGGSGTGAVTFVVVEGAESCRVEGDRLIIIGSGSGSGSGSCTVRADKASDRQYRASSSTLVTGAGSVGWVITPVSGGGGSISPSGPQTVADGDSLAFTVTPNPGFRIDSVSGCGGTLVGDTYTTAAITTDCTVNASFAAAGTFAAPTVIPTTSRATLLLLALLLAIVAPLSLRRRG